MENKFDFFNGHDVFTDHFLDGDEEEMRPSDSDRIQNLRRRVEALELAMSKLGMQVGPETGKNDPKRKPVPQEKLEEYIHEAMLKGDNELGVSKVAIRQHLEQVHCIQDRRYMRRRITAVLNKRIEDGQYKTIGNLFKIIKPE